MPGNITSSRNIAGFSRAASARRDAPLTKLCTLKPAACRVVGNQAGDILVVFYNEDERARRACGVALFGPLVGIHWQVHALLQATHEVTDISGQRLTFQTVLGECCGNVSLWLKKDEFVGAVLTSQRLSAWEPEN